MRATCVADDLPKLKPYPWERIFPNNTPSEAIDLAQRLLRYDPDERLTAPQALAHPFFDGIDQLVEGSSSSTTGLPPLTPGDSMTPVHRPALPAVEWERRVLAHFEELKPNRPMGDLLNTVTKSVESALQQSAAEGTVLGPQDLTRIVKHDFASFQRSRDEAMRGMQARLGDEAKRHKLPSEAAEAGEAEGAGAAGSSSSGGAASSSGANGGGNGGGEAEAVALKAQLDELKQAQRGLSEAVAEKNDLAARIKAAQRRLEAPAERATSASSASSEQPGGGAEALGGADGEKPAPGFGRRAPAMPTRQATGAEGLSASPMVHAGAQGTKLQTDNLGQVTPLGFSPGSEAGASPGQASFQRPSSSGRRRSRLSEQAGEGGGEVGEGGEN